jgi:hypothetical protein
MAWSLVKAQGQLYLYEYADESKNIFSVPDFRTRILAA